LTVSLDLLVTHVKYNKKIRYGGMSHMQILVNIKTLTVIM